MQSEDSESHTSGTNSDDGSFGDWDAPDEDVPIASLLGGHTLSTVDEVWAELRAATGFDVASRSWGMYELVRFVNYLRHSVKSVAEAEKIMVLRAALEECHVGPRAPLWRDDTFLLPVLEDDGLIMGVVAGVGCIEGADKEEREDGIAGVVLPEGTGISANGELPFSGSDDVATLKAQLSRTRELLHMISSEDEPTSSSYEPYSGKSGARDNLTYYFDSYASNTGIHRTMLADRPRTEAYRAALQHPLGSVVQENWVAGKRVLDLGCGTGILSMFAVDAGASAVVALDASSVINDAASIVELNGKSSKIACVRGLLEDTPLHRIRTREEGSHAAAIGGSGSLGKGGSRCTVFLGELLSEEGDSQTSDTSSRSSSSRRPCFDVIVSEWMGYALLYESMLSSVLTARDKYLSPGGILMPSSASIHLGAVSDTELWGEKVEWWRNVYGYDMSPMASHSFPEPLVEDLPLSSLVSAPPHAHIRTLRMASMSPEEQDIRGASWSLRLQRDKINPPHMDTGASPAVMIHALAIWFDVGFAYDPYSPSTTVPLNFATPGVASATPASGGKEKVEEEENEEGCPEAEAVAPTQCPLPQPSVILSTSPADPPGHWHHTILLFKHPFPAPPSGTLQGSLSMYRDAENPRTYHFHASVEGVGPGGVAVQQKWYMS